MTITLTATVLVLGFARGTHAFPSPRTFAAEPLDGPALALFFHGYRRPVAGITKRAEGAATADLARAKARSTAMSSAALSIPVRHRLVADVN